MWYILRIYFREDDKDWPAPDSFGKQELEIVYGDEHISFQVYPQIYNTSRLQNSALSTMYKIAKTQTACESFTTCCKTLSA